MSESPDSMSCTNNFLEFIYPIILWSPYTRNRIENKRGGPTEEPNSSLLRHAAEETSAPLGDPLRSRTPRCCVTQQKKHRRRWGHLGSEPLVAASRSSRNIGETRVCPTEEPNPSLLRHAATETSSKHVPTEEPNPSMCHAAQKHQRNTCLGF
ncbi:unnamed protein product [Schistocephalus solidus]|uniref:Uncharacterized protein n=1 Tax=Schistocephalus solidus TaxID=70667 RepID=A0A183S9P6_SCHSO|nr:unnamed protein product [Schistocephalus solidus]